VEVQVGVASTVGIKVQVKVEAKIEQYADKRDQQKTISLI